MKLKKLIEELRIAHAAYILKYDKEPILWGWEYENDSTLLLCSGSKKIEFGTEAKAPYLSVKIKGLSDVLS